ncbi:EAL domain-containing protein [Oceanisphaera sp. IT1-181]|uniref:EAL domain-containing protein n=1 Tax=Oceanisphaera sp. IT1-181 TaxID=3081199 RepID=UPI0029CA2B74|nr:EAL domain-containing protein [Oceanisphaera sp. IT1-181]
MKRLFASYPRLDGQYGRVSAIKFLLGGGLLLVMLYFGSGASLTLGKIRVHNTLLEQRTYEVPWSLMQLQLEMGRFLDAVRLRHAAAISQDDFMLRYDILWSRTPILLSSQIKNGLGERPELGLLIRQIDARIHELELTVEGLQPHSPDYLVILTALSPYLEPLSRNVSALMHDNVRFYAEYDLAYRQLGKQLYRYIEGFFIALLLLLLLLFRELHRYWRLQQQDPLTGLPNRFALQRHISTLIEQDQPFSLTLLELKDLHSHYQHFGFKVIDQLLQTCCERLQGSLLGYEYLAQPSEGKIMVVGKGVVELVDIRAQLSRFTHVLSEKASVDGYDFYMEPLMGVVLYPFDADNLVDLQARCELALELCKQQQKNYVFFDPSLLKEISRRQQLAKDLPAAITSNSLTLQLQPLIAWPAQQCVGLQVLTSWHHPSFGVIAPVELQRMTEQYQCSERVMLWSLHAMCSQLRVWQRHAYHHFQPNFPPNSQPHSEPDSQPPLFISVTLPAPLFRLGIEVSLMAVLQQYSIAPASLVLEINEQVVATDILAANLILARIRAVGIRIMLTEFGSGSAPLGPLSQLPLDWLKLNATQCTGIEHQGDARRQLTALLAMAEVLAVPVVCCGVDHVSELAVLENLVLDRPVLEKRELDNHNAALLVQGDAVGEPLLVTEVGEWLKRSAQLKISS